MEFARHYTLEEARAALPEIRRQLARARVVIGELKTAKLEAEKVERLVRSNGNGASYPQFGPQIAELQKIVKSFAEGGIEVKSLEEGLIDFPHWRDGREVLLCWLYGEDDIFYWHTIEDGFSGRTRV